MCGDNMEEKYIKIREQYTKKMNNSINENYNKLINSFTDFYGNSYRDYIKNRFELINYVYYIPVKTIENADKICYDVYLSNVTICIHTLSILGIKATENDILKNKRIINILEFLYAFFKKDFPNL